MKRRWPRFVLGVGVLAVVLAVGSMTWAAEEKKITGTVVAVPDDPGGKFAPIAIQCKDGDYKVVKNSIATKIQKKWIGKKLEISGEVATDNGQKTIAPWVFIESGVKVKAQPTG